MIVRRSRARSASFFCNKMTPPKTTHSASFIHSINQSLILTILLNEQSQNERDDGGGSAGGDECAESHCGGHPLGTGGAGLRGHDVIPNGPCCYTVQTDTSVLFSLFSTVALYVVVWSSAHPLSRSLSFSLSADTYIHELPNERTNKPRNTILRKPGRR